jgi:enediyne biosynthesis protein E4
MFRKTVLLVFVLVLTSSAHAQITFRDITRQAGINYLHNNGARGKKYLPETMGPGAAFSDFNNDGYPDILMVNGQSWPGDPQKPSTMKLYRNNQNGTFIDVTARAGLAVPMFGMGVAVGDYDNDGNEDLFVTSMGQSHLYRNTGNGRFTDVTKLVGLWGPNEFSSSAAWIDYDHDGKLDLVVANYVQWSQKSDIYCTLDGKSKSYCTPESYKGASARVWHNIGSKFEDVTRNAGMYDASSKGLGVAVLDANSDGWPDLLLANDTQPNKLYVNNKQGKFVETGVSAGVAFSEDGVARAGMGVDAADYDRSGRPSIVISNFANQMMALYHNEGNGLFVDEAPRSAVGRESLLTLGFACFFFDYDNDGWLDIFVANGHIENEIERIQKRVKFMQPPHLFRNAGGGRFQEVTEKMGSDFNIPRVARGAAYADIDNDGDLDVLIMTNGGRPSLLRNDGVTNRSLRVKLLGTKSNRSGIGAMVTVTANGGKQSQLMRSGSSYMSSNELVLTFGLGNKTDAEAIEVRWPSGRTDKVGRSAGDQTITIEEGKGIVSTRKYGKPGPAMQRASAAAKTRSASQ